VNLGLRREASALRAVRGSEKKHRVVFLVVKTHLYIRNTPNRAF